jgi:hypothetical protein
MSRGDNGPTRRPSETLERSSHINKQVFMAPCRPSVHGLGCSYRTRRPRRHGLAQLPQGASSLPPAAACFQQ